VGVFFSEHSVYEQSIYRNKHSTTLDIHIYCILVADTWISETLCLANQTLTLTIM